MLNELERLMAERNLDAILVAGSTHANPPMFYVMKGAHVGKATLYLHKRGAAPVVIANPMEREEAAQAGYAVLLTSDFDYAGLLRDAEGDALKAEVAYYRRIFERFGVRGRVGFYGLMDQGAAYCRLQALAAALVDVEIVGELEDSVIMAARATKSAEEIARIREVGRRTQAVVQDTIDFLSGHTATAEGFLRRSDGDALRVGDVHAFIRARIAAHGLQDPEGFIFATGRDAGIPHSKGTLEAPLRLGESIVFDIFPQESGGGYFFDFTRTFALGYAPEALEKLYADVLGCLNHVKAAFRVGEFTRIYQQMTCEYFAQRGHVTLREDSRALSGYIHSVGHGLGLDVHEVPFFRDLPTATQRLEPGHVFTVEPGLYYPEQGMGVRLEDVMAIDEAGTVTCLTEFPYELVVPVKGTR